MNSFLNKLNNLQIKNKSSLIIGLDIEPKNVPKIFSQSIAGYKDFLKKIIDSTSDLVAGYKPNSAFFEALGLEGIELLQDIIAYIPNEIPIILDVKRGDIDNTAKKYAYSAFNEMSADAVTLSPYMGSDGIVPFLEFSDKYSFVLALTSNKSASQLEMLETKDGKKIYEKTAELIADLNQKFKNCGAVVGATKPEQFKTITSILKDECILVPGIGAQGGSVSEVLKNTQGNKNRILFNVSRAILYASFEDNFAKRAREVADNYRNEIMEAIHV